MLHLFIAGCDSSDLKKIDEAMLAQENNFNV